jgi:hypothetical protein
MGLNPIYQRTNNRKEMRTWQTDTSDLQEHGKE